MITVHSDKKRSPRYWVDDWKGCILFESESGDEAVQWAIDYQSYTRKAKNNE